MSFPVRKARLLAGFLLVAAALLGGCAGPLPQSAALLDNPPRELPPRVELTHVPFHDQQDAYCGPASLAMVFNAAGVEATADSLADFVYLPGRRGSLQVEMLAAARRKGLVAYRLEPELTDILREVASGTPVVVLENYGFRIWPKWHYAVVIGYDLERGELIRRSGDQRRQTMPFYVFEYVWKSDGRWAMVALPPGRIPATATETRYARAVSALEQAGDARNARIAYRAMLERWPRSLAAWIGAGNTAYALGDLDAAEHAFRQAAQFHPDSPAAHNNLAHVLAERGRLEEALASAERAVSLGGPLLPAARSTLQTIRSQAAGLHRSPKEAETP